MKRQFKFRVWDKDFNRFLTPKDYSEITRSFIPDETKTNWNFSTFSGDIWQQWTGLVDKNKKEIYEGDIVKTKDNEIGKIVYDESGAKFLISFDLNKNKINHDNSVYFSCGGDCNPRAEDVILIGNIFENPELLN